MFGMLRKMLFFPPFVNEPVCEQYLMSTMKQIYGVKLIQTCGVPQSVTHTGDKVKSKGKLLFGENIILVT